MYPNITPPYVFLFVNMNKMASCFCCEDQARASAHVVIKIEDGTEMVPMGPLESSDGKDFENVEVVEER